MPSAIMQAVLSGNNEELQKLLENPELKIEDLKKEEKSTGYTAFDRAVLMGNKKAQDLISGAFLRFRYKKLREESAILEEKYPLLLKKSLDEDPDLFLNELNKLVEKQESKLINQLVQYESFKHLSPVLALMDEKKSERSTKWPELFDSALRNGNDDVHIYTHHTSRCEQWRMQDLKVVSNSFS
jgi:hypothetical protein